MVADRGRAVALLGASLVALLLATPAAWAHGGVADYRWVDAPVGSPAATGLRAEVPAGAGEAWTPDLQAVLTLPTAAVGATPRSLEITPVTVDERLPALPPGLAAAGNAYRIDVDLDAPGRLVLAAAHAPTGVLTLEGDGWRELPADGEPDGRVGAPVAGSGTYLAVTTGGHGAWPGTIPAAVAAVGVSGLLVARRRRTRTPAPS